MPAHLHLCRRECLLKRTHYFLSGQSLLASERPIEWACPIQQDLTSLSTGIGSFNYAHSQRTLQGSARNLLISHRTHVVKQTIAPETGPKMPLLAMPSTLIGSKSIRATAKKGAAKKDFQKGVLRGSICRWIWSKCCRRLVAGRVVGPTGAGRIPVCRRPAFLCD